MKYEAEDHPSVRVIHFEGDLGREDEAALKKLFVRLREGESNHVVFDLADVSFMDSTQLGTLVWGLKNLREAGGDLRLCGLQGFVANLFEMTELDKAFRTYPDRRSAVDSFTG